MSAGFAAVAVVHAAAEVEGSIEAVGGWETWRRISQTSPSLALAEPLRAGDGRREDREDACKQDTLHVDRLVAQRVQNHVDTERVSVGSELEEVPGILSLALPRVVDVRVMRHEDHQPAGLIADSAAVDLDAVVAVLGGAAAGTPHTDRRESAALP